MTIEGNVEDDGDFPGRFFAEWGPDALRRRAPRRGLRRRGVHARRRRVDHAHGAPSPDAARLRRCRDAAARLRPQPERVRGRRRRRVRAPGQPLLACRARGRARDARPRSGACPRRARCGHDRPREAGNAARRCADDATSTAPASRGSSDSSSGCGRARSASSVSRAIAPRSTAEPSPDRLPDGFGGVPAYLMPNPSGVNAHARVDDLADHLRAAMRLARDD